MSSTFYIIDGHAYSYQAFYGVISLHSPDGMPSNAVFGFIKMLHRLIEEKQPQYLAVCFDTPKKNFRHDSFEDYKANRKPMPNDLRYQIPIIQDILQKLNIPIFSQEGYEADDIMATVTKICTEKKMNVCLVTPDKDMGQLISDNVCIWDSKKNCLIGRKEIFDKYHLQPEQLPEYFALIGDDTDNIPGVPGLGPKRAMRLISQWPTLELLYENIANVHPPSTRKYLEDNRDAAFLSRQLFKVNGNVPIDLSLEKCSLQKPNYQELIPIYQKLGFYSLLSDLLKSANIPSGADSSASQRSSPSSSNVMWVIQNQEELENLAKILEQQAEIILALDFSGSILQGISFLWEQKKVAYINCKILEQRKIFQILKKSLSAGGKKSGHDLKSILKFLAEWKIELSPLGLDTMLAGYLLSSSGKEYSFNDLCVQYLACHAPVLPKSKSNEDLQDGFAEFMEDAEDSQQKRLVYWSQFMELLHLLVQTFRVKLKEQNLQDLLETLELPLIPILAEMEYNGITLDLAIFKDLASKLQDQLAKLQKEIYSLAGESFTILSSQQLGAILFDKLKLGKGKKNKTGYVTDAETLENLVEKHPLPSLILDYRHISKLLNTYLEGFPKAIDKNNRIHTTLHQTGTATGRISSSNPNLQNIPIRQEDGEKIRQAFIASPGHVLIAGDYSQIELRVLASFCQDPYMVDAFEHDKDIHSATAALLFNIPQGQVSSQQRRIAKAVNFGIIYGQSAFGLSKELNIPIRQAQEFITSYFQKFSHVRGFMEEVLEETRRILFVGTIGGRKRYIPEIISEDHNLRKMAERMAFNTVMQGSVADIVKQAMIYIVEERRQTNIPFRILLQIHDELLIESEKKYVAEVTDIVKTQMLKAGSILGVTVKVNVASGTDWAQAHA